MCEAKRDSSSRKADEIFGPAEFFEDHEFPRVTNFS